MRSAGAAVLGAAAPRPGRDGPPASSEWGVPPDWAAVQSAFTLDRSAIYLNVAGIGPAPRSVLDAVAGDVAFTNRLPARHAWRVLEPGVERARTEVAAAIGADPDEVALTRGATEAVEIVQLGLDLEPGDEVLTSDQDFFRMLHTWEQRERREGVRLVTVPLPLRSRDPEEIVAAFRSAITSRTRVLLLCHVTNLSGLVLPVARICRMAAERGIRTVVDGAQAFGHVPVDVRSLGCDYYGASLHKYALGPLGTGFLYVRGDRIPDLWALTPARPDLRADIRKFEDVGTHSAAPHNAVPEALRFVASIGAERVRARLRALASRLVRRVEAEMGNLSLSDPVGPFGSSIVTLATPGEDPRQIVTALWERERVVVRAVRHPECTGVRMSPHVYNTPQEIDHVAAAFVALLHARRSEP